MSINGKNLRMELHRNVYTDDVINKIANEIAEASNSTVKNVDLAAKKIEIVTANSNRDKVADAVESTILKVINDVDKSCIYEAVVAELGSINKNKSVCNMYNIIPSKVGNKTSVRIEL